MNPPDPSLCRIVHTETECGWTITAALNRFGGLTVIAEPPQEGRRPDWTIWQGDNILDAREHAAGKHEAEVHRRRALVRLALGAGS